MADKKGGDKGGKGAPKKEAPELPNGHDYVWVFAGILFVIIGISTLVSSSPLFSWIGNATSTTSPQVIPSGTLGQNASVADESATMVYANPGTNEADLVGTQDAGAKGTITDGPKTVDGVVYYYVHYDNPPDGWVSGNSITSHTGLASTAAFFPAFFSTLHFVFSFLAFLLFLMVIYVVYQDETLEYPVTHVKNPESPLGDYDKDIPVARRIIPSGPVLPGAVQVQNEHWTAVLALLESHNQNDWRQAIIESDIMLDEMLEKMGYDAPSVGEKLKMIEPSDFTTLDDAWEAHKVRNRIAHDGKDYPLGQMAAKKVIGLYEKVFKEFYYI